MDPVSFNFSADHPHELFTDLFKGLMFHGENVNVRKHNCIKYPSPVYVCYETGTKPFILKSGRGFNLPFALVEVLSILGANPSVKLQARFNANVHRFSDTGHDFAGHYGVRMNLSMQRVIDLLREDEHTRQAVVPIYHPIDAMEAYRSKDIPCNTMLYFKIVHGALEMMVVRRSNDIFWGYATNCCQFMHVHCFVASMIGRPVGRYRETIMDLHAYKDTKEDVEVDAFYDVAKVKDILLRESPDPHYDGGIGRLEFAKTGYPTWHESRDAFGRVCQRLIDHPVGEDPYGMFIAATGDLMDVFNLYADPYWGWLIAIPCIQIAVKEVADPKRDVACSIMNMARREFGEMPKCLRVMYRDYLTTWPKYRPHSELFPEPFSTTPLS